MNDIIEPTKPREGEKPTITSNTLDLKTPEQREADKRAAEERAARVASQGGKQVNNMDGMVSAKPTSPNAVMVQNKPTNPGLKPALQPNAAPQPKPPQASEALAEPSVFKLGSTIPEEKQGNVDGSSPVNTAEQQTPHATESATKKKPGFLEKLKKRFGSKQ